MPRANDGLPFEKTLAQRTSKVKTGIVDSVKGPAHVEQRDLTVARYHYFPLPRLHVCCCGHSHKIHNDVPLEPLSRPGSFQNLIEEVTSKD